MSQNRQLTNRSRRSRQQILQGATLAFSRKGFYGTTTREISEACGLEQSSIYHHFGDKLNLFKETLIFAHQEVLDAIASEIVVDEDLLQELISIFAAILRHHKQEPERVFFIFSMVYSAPEEILREYSQQHGPAFRRLIEIAFDRNPPERQVSQKLSLVVDLLHSYLLSLSVLGSRSDRVVMLKRSLRFILQND